MIIQGKCPADYLIQVVNTAKETARIKFIRDKSHTRQIPLTKYGNTI